MIGEALLEKIVRKKQAKVVFLICL